MATKSKKKDSSSGAIDFEQYLNEEYGKPGTKKRFEAIKKLEKQRKKQLLKGHKSIPPNLYEDTLNYDETRLFAIEELDNYKFKHRVNIRQFCRTFDLDYQIILNLRSKTKNKPYTNGLRNLLVALGYNKTEIVKEIRYDIGKRLVLAKGKQPRSPRTIKN